MERNDPLPSWRPGTTRDALEAFLAAAEEVPVVDRVAYFDNDGTLWCERPSYVQLDFFLDALRRHVTEDPSTGERAEFAALLSGDRAAVAGIGLERIALALAGLFEGMTPQEFTSAAREFMGRAAHPTLDRPTRSVTYQPMSELIAELRRRDFTVANEGSAKVANIQTQLGRRPILAAGNSGGDREMLEWAQAAGSPSLALLIDHDDAEREFHYTSTAQTFAKTEPITDVGARLGWTVVSMARDWDVIFPPVS
jgi:hypothetical protein